MTDGHRSVAEPNRYGAADHQRNKMTELPLFPLKNVVLFPGMVLPLHIFEPRYQELINHCLQERSPFGVVLIKEGLEVGGGAVPHRIGTTAKITRVERLPEGHMNITTVGLERFVIEQVHQEQAYLTATVKTLPTVNGSTKPAIALAQRIRPRIFEYVELIARVNNTELRLDRLPEDPATLAMLVAIALQANPEQKQRLLGLTSVPDMLAYEFNTLGHEVLMLRYMAETQGEVQHMNIGMTGSIFPN